MATSPSIHPASRSNRRVWIPALLAVLVICVESQNAMGAVQTSNWISEFMHWTGHQDGIVAALNHGLRKGGHFIGYGLLGLCFAHGWMQFLRRRVVTTWTGLRMRAGVCSIASAFFVACCDESHQMFLATRGASVWDVLLDTSGALVLSLLLFGYLALRRRSLLSPPTNTLTTLGLSIASLPGRAYRSPEVQRLRRAPLDRTHR